MAFKNLTMREFYPPFKLKNTKSKFNLKSKNKINYVNIGFYNKGVDSKVLRPDIMLMI